MDITEGAHLVTLTCPECATEIRFPIELTARLTVDAANGGKLKPVLSSKATQHSCDGVTQPQFVFVGEPKDSA